MKYFGSHLGIEGSTPWGPKFINFVFVMQGAFVPNFKSIAQMVFEKWTVKYFGGYLGIEDSTPWGSKFRNFVFVLQRSSVPNFKSVAQIVFG